MPGLRLKQVISYIEDNLGCDLSLPEIAAVAGMSASHCKNLFRDSMGRPIHRYVLERRVDRAQRLLRDGALSISEVALETGFAHPSHMAFHMRRAGGSSPKALRAGSGHA